jgi:pimeloyl-ACP methyl ester carboxylesterase
VIVHGALVRSGDVRRDGQRIHWEEFGTGPDVLLLLPTWSIVHSDFWRHQVPHFARDRRVVVFDGLGNGGSDRPTDPSCYGDLLVADDAVAVLDACGVERVTSVLGSSQGGPWALALAALHPERVGSAVFIAPNVPLAPGHPERVAAAGRFLEDLPEHPGWLCWNRAHWLADFPDFLRFFFSRCFTEPDSEAEIEHFLEMGLQTTPEVLLATGGDGRTDLTPDLARDLAARVRGARRWCCTGTRTPSHRCNAGRCSRTSAAVSWSSCPAAGTSRTAGAPRSPTGSSTTSWSRSPPGDSPGARPVVPASSDAALPLVLPDR